jgi:hypothetical protein
MSATTREVSSLVLMGGGALALVLVLVPYNPTRIELMGIVVSAVLISIPFLLFYKGWSQRARLASGMATPNGKARPSGSGDRALKGGKRRRGAITLPGRRSR